VSDATVSAYQYGDWSIDYDDWSSYIRDMTTLPDTVVRRAHGADLGPLLALVERCSAETLYRRFHGGADRSIRRELGRIAAPTATHRSWVAVSAGGEVRGTATLAWSRSGAVEAAFLVEDAWFRRGIGHSLFAALAAEAAHARVETVVAAVQADNDRAVRFLRAVAPGARPTYVGGAELELAIPVGPAATIGGRSTTMAVAA
jgi:N-acetylglutamate synthase-like GNAT family acetyltransferase